MPEAMRTAILIVVTHAALEEGMPVDGIIRLRIIRAGAMGGTARWGFWVFPTRLASDRFIPRWLMSCCASRFGSTGFEAVRPMTGDPA